MSSCYVSPYFVRLWNKCKQRDLCSWLWSFLRIWSHFLKKFLMKNFIFLCSVRIFDTVLNATPECGKTWNMNQKNSTFNTATLNSLFFYTVAQISLFSKGADKLLYTNFHCIPLPCRNELHLISLFNSYSWVPNKQGVGGPKKPRGRGGWTLGKIKQAGGDRKRRGEGGVRISIK